MIMLFLSIKLHSFCSLAPPPASLRSAQFDTVLYNAGHHHNFNNVHGSGIMGSAERIADVKEEYSNLLARLIEVGGSHNQGRAFMVETVGQNFPNDSGIYLGKKSEVVGEGGCSGPWDEGRWQEVRPCCERGER